MTSLSPTYRKPGICLVPKGDLATCTKDRLARASKEAHLQAFSTQNSARVKAWAIYHCRLQPETLSSRRPRFNINPRLPGEGKAA
jgi:hypothetical protein